MTESKDSGAPAPRSDFIRDIVAADMEAGRFDEVVTRFPPEPNGYLHIGHAKAICLSFGIAEEWNGRYHLRFDDTNPETENEEFVEAIQRDVRWLGFDWGPHLYFASDYFEGMYECAEKLIRKGKAYVDSSSEEEIREARGTVTEPGRPTAYRDRSVEENLDLFRRMRAGEFANGAHVLRAKADLASPNMIMRDPVLYRIRHADHYRTGDAWCIYPLYDYAHCLEDAFEGITHSLCSMEFENNREIYDWILDEVGFREPRTHQYEFNRLTPDYTVVSKRRLIRMVAEGHTDGWDDPRMPTLAGLRRRGVPPEAIRRFVDMAGVAKTDARMDIGKLEFAIRDTLNPTAPRVMAVLDPLKVVLTNYPEGDGEELVAPLFPHDVPREGTRPVPFGRELWIERSDFAEDPPKGFRRLVPGEEVRLRYGYVIRCREVVKDADGRVVELRCTYDPDTRGGDTPDGRKVKGTIQWVSAAHGVPAEVRLYDRLFTVPDPDAAAGDDGDFLDFVNPESRVVVEGAVVEPWVAGHDPAERVQFERTGYFWRDPVEGRADRLVFNRIVTLKDTWGARQSGGQQESPEPTPAAAAPSEPPQVGSPPASRISEARRAAREADPELAARFARYQEAYGLSEEDADVLTGSRAGSDFFESAVAVHDAPGAVAAWVVNDVRGYVDEGTAADLAFDGAALGRLVALVEAGTVSRRAAKDVLAEMAATGDAPEAVVERLGLEKVDDASALEPVVDTVLGAWPEKVAEYRSGRTNLMGLFVGEVMKATRGAADPKLVKTLLIQRLEDEA